MDGVICNWVAGACEAHGRHDLVQKHLEGEYPNDWSMDGELGSDEEVWHPIDFAGHDFWADLQPYPWADNIINMLDSITIPWMICTHARHTCESHSGKIAWLHKQFGSTFNNLIMTKHKHYLAGPDRLLIDDAEHNCEAFVEHGGNAFLFPQSWNSNKGKSRLVGIRLAISQVFGSEVFNVRV
jgi:5'(3')-deoxyribonucleotidase